MGIGKIDIAKKHRDKFENIKFAIKDSYDYFLENYKRYDDFRRFTFLTSLSEADKGLLQDLQKPILEFNMLEAYINRLFGEFNGQEPSFKSQSSGIQNVSPQLIEIVEGICRNILDEANQSQSFQNDIYKKQLSGGFAVGEVFTEYEHEYSFDQVIRLKSKEPTLCGFDKRAKLPHKGDGDFCFEIYPMYLEEAEKYFNRKFDKMKFRSDDLEGFKWSYKNTKNDGIIMVARYDEKIKIPTKIVLLTNGQVMPEDDYEMQLEQWNKSGFIAQPASVRETRTTEIIRIHRYYIVESEMLDEQKTDFKYLPLVFFAGNDEIIKMGSTSATQVTRPLVYQARDNQRLQNYAGQTLANELENMTMAKMKASKESIPEEYKEAYINPQKANMYIYNDYNPDNPDQKLTPPQEVMRAPMPPQITQAFEMAKQNNQAILGSYDAALGINNNQLSGKAISNGAMQSNMASTQFITGHMQGLSQIARICVDLIPKYYKSDLPRSVPIIRQNGKEDSAIINSQNGINLDFRAHQLDVRVSAGASFAVQKQRALDQIVAMAQAMPIFNEFLSEMPGALKIIIDNFEIRNVEQLQQLAEQYIIMKQKQMAEAAKNAQNQINPLQLKMMEIQQKAKDSENQHTIDLIKAQNENVDIQLRGAQMHNENAVQMAKANAETINDATELELKKHDMRHRHLKEATETVHNIRQSKNNQTEASIR